ncbi:MAG TPA: DUF2939 domain-containing protein [Sulfurovum sp.]
MKKLILTLGMIVIVLGAYFASGPFITINGVRSSIKEKDSDRLSSYIEFDLLKKNLKEQFSTEMIKATSADEEKNPLGMMVAGFATQIAEGLLDTYLTPSSIALLLEGEKPDRYRSPLSQQDPGQKETKEPLEEYTVKFVSHDRFYVYTKGSHDQEIKIILQRFGLDWKITNIIFDGLY